MKLPKKASISTLLTTDYTDYTDFYALGGEQKPDKTPAPRSEVFDLFVLPLLQEKPPPYWLNNRLSIN